jgi:hypothetical protein
MAPKLIQGGVRASPRLVQQQYSFKGVEGVKPPLGGEALKPPMLQNL